MKTIQVIDDIKLKFVGVFFVPFLVSMKVLISFPKVPIRSPSPEQNTLNTKEVIVSVT